MTNNPQFHKSFIIDSIVNFVYKELENWKDNLKQNDKYKEYSENVMNENLCVFLELKSRHNGHSIIFSNEKPNEDNSARVDISVYSYEGYKYEVVTVFECKRLSSTQYVTGKTGGIQRFKLRRHGKNCDIAGMIGYIQKEDAEYFYKKINALIEKVQNETDDNCLDWSKDTRLNLKRQTNTKKTFHYTSEHERIKLKNITINHLWIDIHYSMGELKTLENKNITLTQEQSEQLLKSAIFSSMIDEMKIDGQIQAIDYTKEVEAFFKQCSKNDSKHTVRQYRNGVTKLETYTQENNINILKLSPREADNFCISLKDFNLSPTGAYLANASVRSIISSCSTFFSFLERRHMVIRNPFRGTRTRPPIRAKKQVLIPTEKELKVIIENISNSVTRMAIVFIRDTGIRVGALDTLKIKENKYYAYSKRYNRTSE